MDCSPLRRAGALLLLSCCATGASAQTVFLCRAGDGPPLFSDLPCTREHRADATRLGIELHNLARGMALGEADLRHLREIETRRAAGPFVSGLPDPQRTARCAALRGEMDALRRAARHGHDGSLSRERRRLRRALSDACH